MCGSCCLFNVNNNFIEDINAVCTYLYLKFTLLDNELCFSVEVSKCSLIKSKCDSLALALLDEYLFERF